MALLELLRLFSGMRSAVLSSYLQSLLSLSGLWAMLPESNKRYVTTFIFVLILCFRLSVAL